MKSEQDSTNNNENSQISSGQSASSQNKNQINDKMMIPQYWMKWIMLKMT